MKERDREIRRRRRRREKAKKERIRALIAKSGTNPKKKPAEALREVKEEKKIIQRRAATKVIKPTQEAKGHAEAAKKGEE
ncbi:MAG TPA: hypothetical protein VJ202_02775 [Thermodesulfobacteriota bacterium]|nr:hypothetical protein [Deltaproteobacteria bacterium]HKZ46290.1 hypothetical protein [Thermodesulfobacteriota bacterium]